MYLGLRGLQPLDPSARWARIRFWEVYGGFNASGGLRPSVHAGLNAFAENFDTHRQRRNQSLDRPFGCLIDFDDISYHQEQTNVRAFSHC